MYSYRKTILTGQDGATQLQLPPGVVINIAITLLNLIFIKIPARCTYQFSVEHYALVIGYESHFRCLSRKEVLGLAVSSTPRYKKLDKQNSSQDSERGLKPSQDSPINSKVASRLRPSDHAKLY